MFRHAVRRTILFSSVAAMINVMLVMGPVGPAGATVVDLTCLGTQQVRITPGLTFQPKPVAITVTTRYSGCVSPSMPAITSGVHTDSFVIPGASCLGPLLETGQGSETITWNTGQASTFSFARTGNTVGGATVVTQTGTISSGVFAGKSAVKAVVSPALNLLQCLFGGVTDRTGPVTLTLTRL
jgi:hypothetical protein